MKMPIKKLYSYFFGNEVHSENDDFEVINHKNEEIKYKYNTNHKKLYLPAS